MATSPAVTYSVARPQTTHLVRIAGALAATALTLPVLVIHGYHPYAEDGGVYLTGVKYLLNRTLYPQWTGFATAHIRYELFAPLVAGMVRGSRLPLGIVVFFLYIVGIWLTLFAAWQIASRVTTSLTGRFGAVSALALTLTIPVAGTSLMLMDPYLTARNIATPCGLFALVGVLDAITRVQCGSAPSWKNVCVCLVSLTVAAVFHPLMAAYSFGCVLLLLCSAPRNPSTRNAATLGLCVLSIVAAACLAWFSPPVPAGYEVVARTRSYWFLSTWHWYELVGLMAPLAVLAALAHRQLEYGWQPLRNLSWMAIAGGVTALIVSLAFARVSHATSLVARLQPLRIYVTIYAILIITLGAALGEIVLRRHVWRWLVFVGILGPLMFYVQRQTFPDSSHLEFPWKESQNYWEQAFRWIRFHTPENAVFAMDANYITAPEEDTQNFRAIAERSAVPDYAKDGGIASIAPDLTSAWFLGEQLQSGLDTSIGPARLAQLRAAGVDWLVLTAATPTSVPCFYRNPAVKVCRLAQ